ncbi:MAG: DUF2062 domain-containing protein [Acidobacteriota bacterium]
MKLRETTVARRLRRLLGADETPERLAAAWALGVALGLSPFLGFHTGAALALAYLLRLNKLDMLLGTLIANPWTLPVYFPAATLLGRWITGVSVPRIEIPALGSLFDLEVWRQQSVWLKPLLVAWGVGASVAALAGGTLTFVILRAFIAHHRRARLARDPASAAEP